MASSIENAVLLGSITLGSVYLWGKSLSEINKSDFYTGAFRFDKLLLTGCTLGASSGVFLVMCLHYKRNVA